MKKLLLIYIICFGFLTCDSNPNDKVVSIKPNDDLSFRNQMETFRKSYEYYIREMTEGEIINTWYQLFKNTTYKIDGDGKNKNYDCYGAYFRFFEAVGANLVNENIELITKRVKRLNEMNQIIIYKDGKAIVNGGFNNIKRGSIIIFYNPKMSIQWHIGILYGKGNNILQYCEMSGWVGRSNYANISFDSDTIHLIFFPSFQFWIGDLFQKAFSDK